MNKIYPSNFTTPPVTAGKPIFIPGENQEVLDEGRLVIGYNDKKKELFIPENSRYYNTLVLGLKGTGKTHEVLPMMVKQDIENKKAGATIVVTKKDMAYTIYTLAKENKRKVRLLKPSINNEISNKLLWQTAYNYDYINEFIINYKEAIKKKEIVIIDMEILKYKSEGLRAVAMLLLQLQLDIQETDITNKTPHFLYLDDAQYYLPFIEHLLAFSDSYNLGVTLLMQSRSQMIKNGVDYTTSIQSNIRTTLLLNALSLEDVKYYSERFYEHNGLNNFYNRRANSIFYETLDRNNQRKSGIADFKTLDKEARKEVEEKSKKTRAKLLKDKRKEREKQLQKMIEEGRNQSREDYDTDGQSDYDEVSDEPKPFDISLLEESDSGFKDKIYKLTSEFEGDSDKKKELKEIITIEEKEIKRKVSSQIFNKLNSQIDYCDDNFDFKFD